MPGVLSGHRRSGPHCRVCCQDTGGVAGMPGAWSTRPAAPPAPLPDQAQPVFFQSWQPDVLKYASEALIVTTAVPFTLLFAMIESVECSASLTRSQ